METRIIEIGGVKMEVDLRHARTVDTYRVGDNVKVLKKTYGDTFESHAGVIVGFDAFVERPTIVIAYLKTSYSEAGIEFLYLNKDSKDVEICPMIGDEVLITKEKACDQFDLKIEKLNKEIADLTMKKNYFLENFKRAYGNRS